MALSVIDSKHKWAPKQLHVRLKKTDFRSILINEKKIDEVLFAKESLDKNILNSMLPQQQVKFALAAALKVWTRIYFKYPATQLLNNKTMYKKALEKARDRADFCAIVPDETGDNVFINLRADASYWALEAALAYAEGKAVSLFVLRSLDRVKKADSSVDLNAIKHEILSLKEVEQ